MQALSGIHQVGVLIHPDNRSVLSDDGPNLVEQFLSLIRIQFNSGLSLQIPQFGVQVVVLLLAPVAGSPKYQSYMVVSGMTLLKTIPTE